MIVEIPNYPEPKKDPVPIVNATVAKSIARPDAFMKPATIGKQGGRGTNETRIRLTNQRQPGRPRKRKRKRDVRDVKFY